MRDPIEPASANPEDWSPEVEHLEQLASRGRQMGGDKRLARQRDAGKLNVRERIDLLLDPGTFREVGRLTGRELEDGHFQPANFVMGHGRVDGRPVVVGGDDFTVRGGSSDAAIPRKQVWSERLAHQYRLPVVRLIEGSGGGGSIRSLESLTSTYVPEMEGWTWVVENLRTVPVVSLVLGSVAGLGAARAVTSHYSVMVEKQSHIFVAGPPFVAPLGEIVTKEELGGSALHTRNGVISDSVRTEAEAIERAKCFLSFLPSSVFEPPPRISSEDPPDRGDEWLIRAIPRSRRAVYRIRPIIESIVDQGSFFEIGKMWGRSSVTGLARLNGVPIAILANDPYHYGGALTAQSSRKVESFVDLAETFRLPVVNLVDQPGFLIGSEAERAGTIRAGARALAAVYDATVPWCTIILRKCFGIGGAAHENAERLTYRYAWPSADWGSVPPEGGIETAYKAQLDESEDPEALLVELHARVDELRDPVLTAQGFGIEEILDPRKTRQVLCEFAEFAAPLWQRGPGRAMFRG